ncbi:MAG: phospho-N-acetylmuramoyl-pentapeptide-transferase [Oscillospiraceae bacterium]|nr:phospho-N-acetylmuramoyl-pentapeptide-transferase [Oscillospiraceae bacterium]
MIRTIISFLIAFVISLVLGRFLIPWLRALKAGQTIKEIGPKWHMTKQGTPTMGGIMFVVGILVAVLALGWQSGDYTAFIVYDFALVFGIIGFIDDFFKVKFHKNEGLTALQKFLLQVAAAIVFVILLRNLGVISNDLYIPFVNVTIYLPWVVYMILAVFIIVGTVNSVNLTDGIDGLATGVTMPVMLFFTAVAILWGRYGAGILSAAAFGGLCAFLIYNFHPAKVFMGDTGSLFLGGLVCGLAFALDIPLVLILVGIIYICETMSDIIQVAYFKLTNGKRIFRMAPLHHHLEMGGWSEVKLFVVFTSITAVCCVLAYLGVMLRFAA